MAGNKPTNDSPIQLKLTPKAQWPLQRFITSDEMRYPISIDNPLLYTTTHQRTASTSAITIHRKPSTGSQDSLASYSPTANSLASLPYMSAQSSLGTTTAQVSANDWIKQIEVNTHIGPHRRLFMGPQFVFKTFNSNLTTTMLNPSSSAVIGGDNENPIIDLSGDIELNSLDLSS